jgi:hypothetical protein
VRRHFDPQTLRELLAVLEGEASPAEDR